MFVKDIMTKDVITVSPDTHLKEVCRIIKEKRISGVPVVDSGAIVVGVITLTDLLKILSRIYQWINFQEQSQSTFRDRLKEEKVREYMSREVISLKGEDTIEDVMRMMFEKKVHTFPVIEEERLVGIVGKRDIVHVCF